MYESSPYGWHNQDISFEMKKLKTLDEKLIVILETLYKNMNFDSKVKGVPLSKHKEYIIKNYNISSQEYNYLTIYLQGPGIKNTKSTTRTDKNGFHSSSEVNIRHASIDYIIKDVENNFYLSYLGFKYLLELKDKKNTNNSTKLWTIWVSIAAILATIISTIGLISDFVK